MANQKQSGPKGGIYFTKGKIVHAAQGIGSQITAVPEAPKLYGPDDEPGDNVMRYSRGGTGQGNKGIAVPKFSQSKAKVK